MNPQSVGENSFKMKKKKVRGKMKKRKKLVGHRRSGCAGRATIDSMQGMADKKFCSKKTTTFNTIQVLPEKMTMADKIWMVIIVF